MSDSLVKLNVGGKLFLALKSTLCGSARNIDSQFFKTLLGGSIPPVKDDSNNIFLDRNPKCFEYILEWLKGYQINWEKIDPELIDKILCDANYYMLFHLIRDILSACNKICNESYIDFDDIQELVITNPKKYKEEYSHPYISNWEIVCKDANLDVRQLIQLPKIDAKFIFDFIIPERIGGGIRHSQNVDDFMNYIKEYSHLFGKKIDEKYLIKNKLQAKMIINHEDSGANYYLYKKMYDLFKDAIERFSPKIVTLQQQYKTKTTAELGELIIKNLIHFSSQKGFQMKISFQNIFTCRFLNAKGEEISSLKALEFLFKKTQRNLIQVQPYIQFHDFYCVREVESAGCRLNIKFIQIFEDL